MLTRLLPFSIMVIGYLHIQPMRYIFFHICMSLVIPTNIIFSELILIHFILNYLQMTTTLHMVEAIVTQVSNPVSSLQITIFNT